MAGGETPPRAIRSDAADALTGAHRMNHWISLKDPLFDKSTKYVYFVIQLIRKKCR